MADNSKIAIIRHVGILACQAQELHLPDCMVSQRQLDGHKREQPRQDPYLHGQKTGSQTLSVAPLVGSVQTQARSLPCWQHY